MSADVEPEVKEVETDSAASRKSSADSSTGSSFEKIDSVESAKQSDSEEKKAGSEEEADISTSTEAELTKEKPDDSLKSEEEGEPNESEEKSEEENDAEKQGDEDNQDEIDPLEAPMKEEQKQFYTQSDKHRAIQLLVLFSIAMFVLPLTTMYYMYHYLIDHFDLPPSDAVVYAGGCGVLVVFIIIGVFIYIAYKEEQDAERQLIESKKED